MYPSKPQLVRFRAFFACKARNKHFVVHILVQQKRLTPPLLYKAA